MNRPLKILLYFSLFVFDFSFLSAQPYKIDSLLSVSKKQKEDSNKVNTFNLLSMALDKANSFDSAIICAEEAKNLAEKIEFKIGLAKSFDALANVYADKDNYPRAMENEQKALAIYQSMDNKNAVATEYDRIATASWKEGDFPNALQLDLKALAIYQETKDKKGIASSYGGIAIVYEEQGNDSLALDYYSKSLAINIELDDKPGLAGDYLNIGNVYGDIGQNGNAITYYFKALEIDKKMGYQRSIARCYGNLAGVYNDMGNYQQSLDYGFMALKIDETIGYKRGTSSKMMGIGSTYTRLKNFKLARLYIDSALNLAKRIKEAEYVKNAYENMAELDQAEGDYKNGLLDYKTYITYRDSLINKANTKKIVQAQMNFEFQQKQAIEKAELDKKEAVAEQERKKQMVIRNSFIAGFLLMFALTFFIFRGYRQKQKANTIIERQKVIVERKQKEIMDSLYYAQKIQKAMLASDDLLIKHLPEYFVLFKPKDIVSGDFYWATIKDNRFYLAVCDSTGHGVPGAFMSLLNISFLNEAITEKNIVQPNEIFNHTRKKLIENISHEGRQDGMDGLLFSLPVFDKGFKHMIYTGAYNTPLVIRNGALIELSADKMPVGASPKQNESFNQQTFELQKGDLVYAFTDGYADQFGGTHGKKFKYMQLQQILLANHKLPMQKQRELLDETLEKWKGGLEQVDDILVMGIRV